MISQKIKKLILTTPYVRDSFEYLNRIRLTRTISVRLLNQKEKASLILDYAKKYRCRIFIETGTYKGNTLSACKDYFDDLSSIELSHELFLENKKRFDFIKKIHLYEGDSGTLLPSVTKINKPTLFWLDAHYSGQGTAQGTKDSPIIAELNFILNHRNDHCILIDDARCFNGKDGYPRISGLKKILKEKNVINKNSLVLEVKNDIIRITKAV